MRRGAFEESLFFQEPRSPTPPLAGEGRRQLLTTSALFPSQSRLRSGHLSPDSATHSPSFDPNAKNRSFSTLGE